ncbi:MAG: SEC-C domain-containing protein, partial [Deltaproteobacteria bacterium]|nr:SEC-C domain-containing protein [Deltaproteobacteria bacterium]
MAKDSSKQPNKDAASKGEPKGKAKATKSPPQSSGDSAKSAHASAAPPAVISPEDREKLMSEARAHLASTGRNDQCHCGSGKKYKKCHLLGDEAASAVPPEAPDPKKIL